MDTQVRRTVEPVTIPEATPETRKGLGVVIGLLRLAMGWTFLWAFLDKAFALGFSTGRVLNDAGETVRIDFFGDAAWINGASPTAGAVGFGMKGPLAEPFQNVVGFQMAQTGPAVAGWFDALYMVSLLLIGLGLMTGVMTRIAAVGGILWMAAFYLGTAIWPEHNPFLDDHLMTIVILVGIILANAGLYWGFGRMWQRVGFVKDRKYLY